MRVPGEVDMHIEFFTGYGCAQARNKAACRAIDGGYDAVLFLDSDQMIPIDTLEKLLACNTDISAGWAMQAVLDNRTNISKYDQGRMYYEFILRNELPAGVISVDAVGFACVLIKTSVLRKLPYPYFRYVEYPTRDVLSEDLYFCNTAKEHGFGILCDTSLKLGHVKSITV